MVETDREFIAWYVCLGGLRPWALLALFEVNEQNLLNGNV